MNQPTYLEEVEIKPEVTENEVEMSFLQRGVHFGALSCQKTIIVETTQ